MKIIIILVMIFTMFAQASVIYATQGEGTDTTGSDEKNIWMV